MLGCCKTFLGGQRTYNMLQAHLDGNSASEKKTYTYVPSFSYLYIFDPSQQYFFKYFIILFFHS